MIAEETVKISKAKMQKIVKDPAKTAAAANLVYVSDAAEGIIRIKNGNEFEYVAGNSKVKDKSALQRIRSLVIPPAWEKVWICMLPNGHL